MISRSWQVIALLAFLPAIAAPNSGTIRVTSVRAWSHPGSTRVVLETTGPFEYRSNRAWNPDRLFFDIVHARPWIDKRRSATREVNDALVKRVRIAETSPGTTRIVFDLASPAEFHVTRLDSPDRMVIEVRPSRPETQLTAHSRAGSAPAEIEPPTRSAPARVAAVFETPPVVEPPQKYAEAPQNYAELPRTYQSSPAYRASARHGREFIYPPPRLLKTMVLLPAPALAPVALPATEQIATIWLPGPYAPQKYVRGMSTRVIPAAHPAIANATAAPSTDATRSLTRALGLKINRVVIDAGHGGHDDGTIGPHGVLEKNIVLDVALRLATLIQNRMGAEVILTRSDDTFIPLQERTAIANDHKADLFISIHANSSPAPSAVGIETFYLNFTNNPAALDVAARENAGSDRSVGDLKDLIQSITLNDKITESQTLARDVEVQLSTLAASANPASKDRGIKRAPFVVLIGASMPSILTEIGFLSNPRDERNLSKPEYREKIAEALYRGISQYSRSLSHFEVASSAPSARSPRGN